jgi:hypothetical protein
LPVEDVDESREPEAGQDVSEKESVISRLQWFKGTMGLIIQCRVYSDYEMVFDLDTELDSAETGLDRLPASGRRDASARRG